MYKVCCRDFRRIIRWGKTDAATREVDFGGEKFKVLVAKDDRDVEVVCHIKEGLLLDCADLKMKLD